MEQEYFNPRTGLRVNFARLSDVEKRFASQALSKFRANMDWVAFDDFAFGLRSPIYDRHKSPKEVLQSPLYLALKDMSLQLGIQQGKIAPSRSTKSGSKGEKAIA
jgi:hypothetical protein